jgi:hypothetical protein
MSNILARRMTEVAEAVEKNPGLWTQCPGYARDADGEPVSLNDPKAASFCAMGLCFKYAIPTDAYEFLNAAIGKKSAGPEEFVEFSETHGRQAAEIAKMFRDGAAFADAA